MYDVGGAALHPYQDRVYGSDDLAMRVNTFLTKASYHSDEGHFAFVFVSDDDITVERILRSAKLDMLAVSDINQARASMLPAKFIPEECVVGPSSGVTKIMENERTFAVFGAVTAVGPKRPRLQGQLVENLK
jgi:hypothetical protein